MPSIVFEYYRQTARFHHPQKDWELVEIPIEVRLDPLLGHQSVLSSGLTDKKTVLFPPTDDDYLRRRGEETQPRCFMCEGRWRKFTPRFPEDFVEGGRFIRGETIVVPNLYPLGAYHAVVMIGERHLRRLNDMPAELLFDAVANSMDFFRRCHEKDPEIRYFTLNANFLHQAGASLIHPHFQLLAQPFPVTHHRLLLDESERYYEKNGSSYWQNLIATEKAAGSRWIGEIGPAYWMTAYAPLGVNEVQAIWPRRRHFLDWGDAECESLALGLSRVLSVYHDMGFSSFNLSVFSGDPEAPGEGFRCFLRLVNRQNAVPNHRTDDYYFQKLLKNEIIIHPPEDLAAAIRARFA